MMPPSQHRLRTRAESHHDGGNHGDRDVTIVPVPPGPARGPAAYRA
jgi:hypothetical protein